MWETLGRIIEALTPPEVKQAKLDARKQVNSLMNEALTLQMKRDQLRRAEKYRNRLLQADEEWHKVEGF